MTRKKKKQPEEGACPECRKLVPLVENDRGSFVLRTHHVVVMSRDYDVEECDGSDSEPADVDDSKDWGWVDQPKPPFKNGGLIGTPPRAVDGDTVTSDTAVGQSLPPFEAPVSLSEAIRAVTADIQRANEATEAAAGTMRGFTPSYVELDGVDITHMVNGPIEIRYEPSRVTPDFTGTILVALRQVWIDETGEPPRDADVRLSTPEFTSGMQLLDIVFQPYGLRIQMPIHDGVLELPGAAEAAGREAADGLRRALRERTGVCYATNGLWPHECREPQHEGHEHRCHVCDWRWRDPVTPSLAPRPGDGLP